MVIISCVDNSGNMLPPDLIFNKIRDKIDLTR